MSSTSGRAHAPTNPTILRWYGTGLGLVTLALLLAAGLSGWHVHEAARAHAVKATGELLESTLSAHAALSAARRRELGLIAEQLAQDKSFVGYFVQARGTGDGAVADTASIRDLLDERRERQDFDVALVLDMSGRVVVDTSGIRPTGTDLSDNPLVATIKTQSLSGFGYLVERGRALQVAAEPMQLGAASEGIVMVGLNLDDAFASRVGAVGGNDVAILVDADGGAQIAATTLDLAARKQLAEIAAQRNWLDASPSNATTLRLGEQDWIARVAGNPTATTVPIALRPAATTLSAVAGVDRGVLIGGASIAALALLSALAVFGLLLLPLARLTRATEPLRRGVLEPVTVRARATDGVAAALIRLSGDLREIRDFEAYASDLLRQRQRGAETGARGAAVPAIDHGRAAARRPGTLLADRYEIYGLVGAGQSGVVYRALDRKAGEVVALKLLGPAVLRDAEHVAHMQTLLRGAARVVQRNVARIRDVGQDDGAPYVAYEYVRGISLKDSLARTGRVPLYAGLCIARKLCAGVAAIHAAGAAHGALSPANVVIEPGTDLRVLDTGIASPSPDFQRGRPDAPLAADPTYLSPQQIAGRPASATDDVYALGVILTELFTARLPVQFTTPFELCVARIDRDAVAPSRLWSEIPRPLEALLLRCLERDPGRRYADSTALVHDLNQFHL